MQAVIYEQYGSPDRLHLVDLPKPSPSEDEVLVKIHAVSINGADTEGLVGKPLYARMRGLFSPGQTILGSDIAGRVELTGKNVRKFQVGDEVFGEIPGYHGGLAEYVCLPEKALAHKPASLSFEEAAAIPQAGVIALQGIRLKGRVQPGQQVLINGAGGSAGSFAIQLAKLDGAEVTGVDHTHKLEFMRSLGADHVIDYNREDFSKTGKQYDLIFELIARRSVFAYQRALKSGGTCWIVGGSVATLFQVMLLGPRIAKKSGKNIQMLMVPQNSKELLTITELCSAGKIRPLIDKVYPLKEAPQAFRYILTNQAKGKIVIIMPLVSA